MAERPDVKTRRLTRDKLALFLPNQELIRAFENLGFDVGEILPDAIASIGDAAENAQALASMAASLVQIALQIGAQLSEGPPQQPSPTAESTEDLAGQVSALRDEVATLRRLIHERFEGPSP